MRVKDLYKTIQLIKGERELLPIFKELQEILDVEIKSYLEAERDRRIEALRITSLMRNL